MENKEVIRQREIVVIGAGLTGLTTAYWLRKAGKDVEILEKQNRTGGQIRSYTENGFTFESGPNTGVISYPEVAELFNSLNDSSILEIAHKSAKRRLIWKEGEFHALPSSLISAITTPLFTLYDKFRILAEPLRAKGKNPNESVAELACRRLGKSFYKYAVDPFVNGVYAGNPQILVTRLALPKLYNLEQNYGSFIRGAIAKAKEPKSEYDKLATKEVFSARGGLSKLTDALTEYIGDEHITLNANKITINRDSNKWIVSYTSENGMEKSIICNKVITTTGAYSLKEMLPFILKQQMEDLTNLNYAPVIEVALGVNKRIVNQRPAFGGLVPSCENKEILGILFPSDCFEKRTPEGGALYSYFIGGMRNTDCINMSDKDIKKIVTDAFYQMLKYPKSAKPDFIRIFRHENAIPQYEITTDKRLQAIRIIEELYPGLTIAGNIRDGIGMADRIKQATRIAKENF